MTTPKTTRKPRAMEEVDLPADLPSAPAPAPITMPPSLLPQRVTLEIGPHTMEVLAGLGDVGEAAPAPDHFPRLTIRTFVESDGYQFEVSFADTPLAEAIQVLKKRGCAPLPINGAAPIESAPAPVAPPKKMKNNDDEYWPDDDDYPAPRSNTNRYRGRR